MRKVKEKPKKNKKLVNMARKELRADGTHGSGKADPTQKAAAGPGAKLYQMG